MMAIRVLWAFVVLLLASCASFGEYTESSHWNRQCYDGYYDDLKALAGDSAQSCGILARSPDGGSSKSQRTCLKAALGNETPFVVAHASYGDDSAFCHAVARDSQGTVWSVFYDFDVHGQNRSNGEATALWVSKCKAVVLEPGTIGPGSFFDATECVEEKNAFVIIQEARSQKGR